MSYQDKKNFYKNILTIYGRNAVEEALKDNQLTIYKLHLAESNKPAPIIKNCISLAKKRDVSIEYHDKRQLSFISKNSKQDQGIALDIQLENLKDIADIETNQAKQLLLLDNVTNPQNIGMIIRSVAAGFIDGIIIPKKGCAELGPLVIKSSVGSIFKASIYRCDKPADVIEQCKHSHEIVGLSLETNNDFYSYSFSCPTIFILGNESEGLSSTVAKQCNSLIKIPMNNGVESLNVAITASLIAFHPQLRKLNNKK